MLYPVGAAGDVVEEVSHASRFKRSAHQ